MRRKRAPNWSSLASPHRPLFGETDRELRRAGWCPRCKGRLQEGGACPRCDAEDEPGSMFDSVDE